MTIKTHFVIFFLQDIFDRELCSRGPRNINDEAGGTEFWKKIVSPEMMKFYEIPWIFMKFYDIPWNTMKFYEILWNSVKFYEILRNSVKFCEILRNSTKFCEILRNSVKFEKKLIKIDRGEMS